MKYSVRISYQTWMARDSELFDSHLKEAFANRWKASTYSANWILIQPCKNDKVQVVCQISLLSDFYFPNCHFKDLFLLEGIKISRYSSKISCIIHTAIIMLLISLMTIAGALNFSWNRKCIINTFRISFKCYAMSSGTADTCAWTQYVYYIMWCFFKDQNGGVFFCRLVVEVPGIDCTFLSSSALLQFCNGIWYSHPIRHSNTSDNMLGHLYDTFQAEDKLLVRLGQFQHPFCGTLNSIC